MFFGVTFLISLDHCEKQKETQSWNTYALLIPFDSAAQWDTISGTISCSTNYSFNTTVDCNHSWHLMMHVFPDERKIFQYNKAIQSELCKKFRNNF